MPRQAPQAWWPLFVAERNAALIERLRWCAVFTLVCGASMGAVATLLGADHLALHVGASLGFAGVALLLWGACALPFARRFATAVGQLYLVILTLVVTAVMTRIPEEALVVPATLISIMLGTTLLLPWGARRQAIVATATVVAYGWVVVRAGRADPATLCLVFSTATVAVVGARLVERLMATSFERAWVQEQLVTFGRTLAAEIEVTDIVAAVVEQARQLVHTTTMSVSLRNPARRSLQVVLDTDPESTVVGFETADDVEPIQRVLAHPIVVLPDDDPHNPICDLLVHHGVTRALYATMQQAGEPLGIIAFVRHDTAPFVEADRFLARAIAEQAALALRTGRLVADLQRANQLKIEFVSTMSHELRTPLNVILGFAEMLDDPAFEGEQRQVFVERIRGAGRDLLELIENTLAVGRLEAGRDSLDLEAVQLPDFWRNLGERCARMPRGSELEFLWQAEVARVELRTDPRKLHMVISNLVSNALKFTERGRVAVTVTLDAEQLQVQVTDTGIGIPKDAHAHIFEMFRQADSSDSRRYGGTGLGLYIVRTFVEQLGGTVALNSTPGQGSTFTIRLPLVSDTSPLRNAA